MRLTPIFRHLNANKNVNTNTNIPFLLLGSTVLVQHDETGCWTDETIV